MGNCHLSFSRYFWIALACFAFAILQVEASSSITLNGVEYSVVSIITRDVCIIGGGSSGTYAAISLSDMGKSVMVVEQKDRLGGHTETYTDPASGLREEAGVLFWNNLPVVRDYFLRLNVSLANPTYGPSSTQFFDFQSGKLAASNISPNLNVGLALYAAKLAKYPYLQNGFDLPSPVPSDLLMPFGEFVVKYDLQSVVGFINRFAQGLGNLLAQPTLYVFKNFGPDVLASLSTGFLTTALHNNHLLYDHALAELKDNVLLSSTVLKVDRSDPRAVKVLVVSPRGLTLVKSNKIMMAIPPKVENLAGWDLSFQERSIFSRFLNNGYYTSFLRNTGIPDGVSVINVSPNTTYSLPLLPGVYALQQSSIPGTIKALFGSNKPMPDEDVKRQIIADVKRLKYPGKGPCKPEFVFYSRHTPFELTASATAIASGFYKDLYSLQGHRNTWYTGAAFHTQDSSLIWRFTETLIGNLTAS